jgi:hypothetical protein
MKRFLAIVLSLVALSAFVGADVAEAKRLGGGGSFGAQRKVAASATFGAKREPYHAIAAVAGNTG